MCGVATPQTFTQWLAGITGNNLVDAELARASEIRLPYLPIRVPIPFADLFPINGFESGLAGIPYLVLPWIIIMVVTAGPDIRIYRTVFLDETKADYVRTAFAKGASESAVIFRHILKNALIPIVTHVVIGIPFLILGAFLMERFFSIPGVGDIMITAINSGDFPILKGLTVLIAIAYTLFNLITDLLYAVVDPRVKLS
jgi:peptide/nickel transport system permease protein